MKCRILSLFLLFGSALSAQNTIDLSGKWEFEIDRTNALTASSKLHDRITLPASMPEQLKGDRPNLETKWTATLYDSSFYHNPYMRRYQSEENFSVPFFLTPKRYYVGTAWYRRTVKLKDFDPSHHYFIHLERPHITSTLYINGREVGSQNSLSAPHEYEVTQYLKKGANQIALRINNEIKSVGVGADSHSVTDQTQGNWNGVVGRIELRERPATYIQHVDVYPDVTNSQVRVVINTNAPTNDLSLTITQQGQKVAQHTGAKHGETTIKIPNALLWDEFTPNLYQLTVSLGDDSRHLQFGMREIRTQGNRILVNGRETQMRGTVENCNFPLTGYPPCDKAEWVRVLSKCKEYGLNHLRFHSYCPPEVAFTVADSLGLYLQPEGPSWPNHGVRLGRGEIIDTYLMDETKRMVEAYGNHPSFCMMACGNEPSGNWVAWVTDFVKYWQKTDPRRIYTGASVGGSWAWQPANEYHVKAGARGLDEWRKREPESIIDFSAKVDTVSQPFIAHEAGQWCVFPDLKETTQYTGVNRAGNFEIFRDLLHDNGMGQMAEKFLQASGKLQALCYKHEMERFLRTGSYAGFQLLGLNDYSGQGSALVGPLNVFFREKGYVDAKEWRQACSPITLLGRLPRFTYFSGDTIPLSIEVNNHDMGPIQQATLIINVNNAEGNSVHRRQVQLDAPLSIGLTPLVVDTIINKVKEAEQMTITMALVGQCGGKNVTASNSYRIWVYPHHGAGDYLGMVMQHSSDFYQGQNGIDSHVIQALEEGKRVLVLAGTNSKRGQVTYGQGIVQQFLPVFWNTSWFKMKPPHTTGMYVQKEHPLFRDFPTDDFSDMQWWPLMNRQTVMLMDQFPQDFQPIIQPIDTWFLSRKLGMLFECRVGKGTLLLTTMPLDMGSKDPVIAQMYYAMLKYLLSNDFQPTQEIDIDVLRRLFTEKTPDVNMFTNDSPDELKKGIK